MKRHEESIWAFGESFQTANIWIIGANEGLHNAKGIESLFKKITKEN